MAFVYERLSLEGKTAIVTGGGQGIGKAIALGLAEVGARVAIAEMNEETGPVTEQEIKDSGREALFVKTDVRKVDQVQSLMATVLQRWGRLDVMANNAGGTFFIPAVDVSPNGFDAIIRENLGTMWHCSQQAAKIMMDSGGGSIVSIASMSAILGAYNHAPYGAAKAGVMGLTKGLAVEWGPHGIRVNAVAPGSIETPGTHVPGRNEDYSHIPAQRKGQPIDIAGAIVFLASDLAAYVTGQTILVDGGMVIRSSSIPAPR